MGGVVIPWRVTVTVTPVSCLFISRAPCCPHFSAPSSLDNNSSSLTKQPGWVFTDNHVRHNRLFGPAMSSLWPTSMTQYHRTVDQYFCQRANRWWCYNFRLISGVVSLVAKQLNKLLTHLIAKLVSLFFYYCTITATFVGTFLPHIYILKLDKEPFSVWNPKGCNWAHNWT